MLLYACPEWQRKKAGPALTPYPVSTHMLTAVIVTYNSAKVLPTCMDALYRDPRVAHVVVSDNASADDTRALVRAKFPAATLLAHARNLGFGVANNRALEKVETPYALLTNPDAVLAPGAAAQLLAAAERYPDAAIIAPLLTDAKGNPRASFKTNVFHRERHRGKFHAPEGDVCAEFLSGAVWLVRMDAWRALGGFDENIFLFHEDDDMCLRARAAGYGLVLAAAARAAHGQGQSSARSFKSEWRKQYHLGWSRSYLGLKYGKAGAGRQAGKAASQALISLLTLRFGKAWKHFARACGLIAPQKP